MEQTRNTHKARDLSIGFFGWFLICTIGFLVSDQDRSFGLYWVYVFPVLTAIVIGILFFRRRNWFAFGIVAAPITNALIWVLLFGSLYGFDWEHMSEALIFSLWYPFFFFVM